MTGDCEVRLERAGVHPTVWVRGVFDRHAVARFRDVVDDAGAGDEDVVVDVSRVTDASVEAAEALVAAANSLASRRRSLVLVGPSDLLRHLLRLGVADLVRVRRPERWAAT
jgi:anti-anti-sigma regulatory factor